MYQKPVSVIFTGQLRDKEMFESSLDGLAGLACVKEIILSTWHGDAVSEVDYLKTLEKKYRLAVVSSTDPNLHFDRFNGFRQSVTIRRGLDAVSKAPYVFKTRTDTHIDPDALRYLADKDGAITDPGAAGMRIFREKVSVTGCSMLAPFYIDDKLIFGHHADLMKLCSTEFGAFKYPSSAKFGHYIRFYPAFMAAFPIFQDFIRHEILVTANNTEFRELFLRRLLARREVGLALSAYYRIVSDFFCMDFGGHTALFRGDQASYVDGAADTPLDPDSLCASNEFFRNASRGLFAHAELGALLAGAATAAGAAADVRDIGNGIDYPAFWAEQLRQAKEVLQFDRHVDEAKRLMREGAIQDAFMMLNRLLPCDPVNRQLRFLIATCYDAVRDHGNAVLFLRSCLELGESYDSLAGQMLRQIEKMK